MTQDVLRESQLEYVQAEGWALAHEGVEHAFAQRIPSGRLLIWVCVKDSIDKADYKAAQTSLKSELELRRPAGGFEAPYRHTEIRVVALRLFNKGMRAVLSRNAELEAELKRIREMTPDVDSALRALDAVVKSPDAAEPADIELVQRSVAQ